MANLRVGIVGAAGQTGRFIVEGLLELGGSDIIALTRPSSIDKPLNKKFASRGIEIRPFTLPSPQEQLVPALTDIDVLISVPGPSAQLDQIPLADAAKAAGVTRFLPCGCMPVGPVGGVMSMRDEKEIVLNHIKKIYLSYTYVDVGWWYQIAYPALPSGKVDYAVAFKTLEKIPGDGNVPSGLTDLRDIGRYFARIVRDDRTVNKMVFVYNELFTRNQIYDLLERLSGEKIQRTYQSKEEIQAKIDEANRKLAEPDDGNGSAKFLLGLQRITNEYLMSWGIRGDNQPDYAKFLGYLTSKELYPEFKFLKFEEYLRDEVLAGTAQPVYEEMRQAIGKEALESIRD